MPTRELTVILAQFNSTVGAVQENTDRILAIIKEARDADGDLIVFPELALIGYPPQDLLERSDLMDEVILALRRIERASRGIAVIVGAPRARKERAGKPLANSAYCCRNGRCIATVDKTLLPTYDIFDERRFFHPNESFAPVSIGGIRFGITLCEDIWNAEAETAPDRYAVDPIAALADRGVDVFLNLSASPFSSGKTLPKREMLSAIARGHRTPLLYCNGVGANDSVIFDGGSVAFDATGTLIAEGAFFEESLTRLRLVKQTRTVALTAVDPLPEFSPSELLYDLDRSKSAVAKRRIAHRLPPELDQIVDALSLGIQDYFRKTGFAKALLGLSGGIDSSLVAALAAKALGSENVIGVMMPSPFNAPESLEDARQLAWALKIQTHEIPITPLYERFLWALHDPSREGTPGITEENLQTRIRGVLLMALSNRSGALLLSTGNKSELATGYCTLYGDMNGALAVIGDLYKTQVYDLCAHINLFYRSELIPRRVFERAPSAELRFNQTDQDTLPPYEFLDAVLYGFLEEGLSRAALLSRFRRRPKAPEMVDLILTMVANSEYKRQQAPIILRVSSKAFGIGRRYPIAARLPFRSRLRNG